MRRALAVVAAAATLTAAAAVGSAPAGAAAVRREGRALTATALAPSGRVVGSKVPSSGLARSDLDLLARTDTTPVPVLLKLDQDPIASYEGGLPGLAATSPAATGHPLTAADATSSPYARRVAVREAEVVEALRAAVPEVAVTGSLRLVYGGLVATVPAARARDVLAVPGVVAVQSDAARVPAPSDAVPADDDAPASAGAGTVVAVLGAGLDARDLGPTPDVGAPRPDLPCEPGADGAGDQSACTGAVAGRREQRDRAPAPTDPAAEARATGATSAVAAAVRRVAPAAWLVDDRVCRGGGCAPSDVLAGLEGAVRDGADVAATEMPAGADLRTDPWALAALDAVAAGTVVVDGGGGRAPWVIPAPGGAGTGRTAGAAAGVVATEPTWSPTRVRAALAAHDGPGLDPAAARAPGLTMDEDLASLRSRAAEPADRVHLDLPVVEATLDQGHLATVRTVANVGDGPATYDVATSAPEGATITVRPTHFTLGPGATKDLDVTIAAGGADRTVVGEVRLEADGRPSVHLPVRVTTGAPQVQVTTGCEDPGVAVGTRTTCTATATNVGSGPATVAGTTTVGPGLRVDAAGSPATAAGPRTATLAPTTLEGRQPTPPLLEPLGFAGYVPLDDLGVDPVPIGDQEALQVDLDRGVTFGGASHDRLGVAADGYVVVGGIDDPADLTCCPPGTGPDPSPPDAVIAPFWTDLTGAGTPGILLASVTDGHRSWVVVEWRVAVAGSGSRRTFQLWLGQDAEQDVALTYPVDDLPSGRGLVAPLAVGAEGPDGLTGTLRVDEAPTARAGTPSADLLVASPTPTPGGSVSWSVEVAGWAGGPDAVRTEVAAAGGAPVTAADDLGVTGPAPGEVEAFVDRVADALVGEAASGARRAGWSDLLRSGTLTRRGLARLLAEDPAWLGRLVDQAYLRVTGAPPDPAGRAFWVEALGHGASLTHLEAALVGSDGFYAAVDGDPAAFVDDVFTRLLGRVPDGSGRDYWVGALGSGLSRAALGLEVARLDEVGARRVTDLSRLVLDRDPSPEEAAAWGRTLREGTIVDLTTAVASGA